MAINNARDLATSPAVNGVVLIVLAIYLGLLLWKGNLGAFWDALVQDLFAKPQGGGPAFWQWLAGLIILFYLAHEPATKPVFQPLLYIALFMMLLVTATKNPGAYKNIFSAINQTILGRPA